MNQVFADAELFGEFAARPMSGAVEGLAAGGVENFGAKTSGQLAGRLSGPMSFEPVESVLEKAFLPLPDGGRGGVELGDDGLIGQPRDQ